MGKSSLIDWQEGLGALSDPIVVVECAADTAAKLTKMRSRGPGDLDNAMRSVAQETGVGYSILWSLRYRRNRVKDISTSVFFKLQSAYRAACERQMRKLQNEIYVAGKVGASDADLRKAEAVVAHPSPARRVRGDVQAPRQRLSRALRGRT